MALGIVKPARGWYVPTIFLDSGNLFSFKGVKQRGAQRCEGGNGGVWWARWGLGVGFSPESCLPYSQRTSFHCLTFRSIGSCNLLFFSSWSSSFLFAITYLPLCYFLFRSLLHFGFIPALRSRPPCPIFLFSFSCVSFRPPCRRPFVRLEPFTSGCIRHITSQYLTKIFLVKLASGSNK